MRFEIYCSANGKSYTHKHTMPQFWMNCLPDKCSNQTQQKERYQTIRQLCLLWNMKQPTSHAKALLLHVGRRRRLKIWTVGSPFWHNVRHTENTSHKSFFFLLLAFCLPKWKTRRSHARGLKKNLTKQHATETGHTEFDLNQEKHLATKYI